MLVQFLLIFDQSMLTQCKATARNSYFIKSRQEPDVSLKTLKTFHSKKTV